MRRLLQGVCVGFLLILPACGGKSEKFVPAPAQQQPVRDAVPAPVAIPESDPIPQNPELQKKRFEDTLAWNQRTLVGAYDKVGKKDPRWDKLAHETLEATVRYFSQQTDPCIPTEELYALARQAIDAGCDDPLILYVYACSSYGSNFPGLEEQVHRYHAAAVALEDSAYPPFRQCVALNKAAFALLESKPDRTPEVRKETKRLLDASLALLAKSVQEDERTPNLEKEWFESPGTVFEQARKLMGDSQAAFDYVDPVLAKMPELEAIRLQVRAHFLIEYAWEARGNGFANTVTEEGWRNFRERLLEARQAIEQSWALQPNEARTATMMLMVEKGIGGDRDEMEKWFQRAMQANGDYQPACVAKLDWLDPKWHGSREEMLAFGRACRDTKNWRAGITLLVADAHFRAAQSLPRGEQTKYWHSPEVRKDIQSVYAEYLGHYTTSRNNERTRYAGFCYLVGDYAESDKQFRILGDNLIPCLDFPELWLKKARQAVPKLAQPQAGAAHGL